MTDGLPEDLGERVLILAPTAWDAATSRDILTGAGLRGVPCATVVDLCGELARGAGAALVTAEAVLADRDGLLAAFLSAQPPWSDLPLIVLTPPGEDSPRLLRALEAVGPVSLMKRPVQVSMLVSAARTALRDRRRQYTVRDLLAEREGTAEALRVEREQYRITLSSIGDAVVATDTAGNITFLNPVAEDLTGWDIGAARGRPLEDVFRIVNESSRRPVENPARRALDEGVIVGLANHTILIARDGTEYPIDDSAAPIRARDTVTGAVLVFRDITERKKAEAEREHLTETLRLALDAGDLGTWDWDPATDAMVLSERTGQVYGVEPGRPHQREPLRELIHPSYRDRAREAATRAAAERVDYGIEYLLVNGRWVAARGRGVYGPEGGLIRMIGVVQDVTARKQAEAALSVSDAQNRFLLDLEAATRPLTDPAAIMAAANRVLGERLRANRVLYFEIAGPDFLVERDYADGVGPLAGRCPVASFGAALVAAFVAGRTVVEADATTHPGRSEDERAAFAAIRVRGHVDVPLVKAGGFVAGLTVHSATPREWTADEVALIEATAERTWAAVERARAERTLRASEARFRTLFDSMDQGFCVIDVTFAGGQPAGYRFVELNPAFERHSGLPTALLGNSIREAVPGLEEFWFDTYGRVAATGEPIRFVHHAAPLGRWFEVYAFRLEAPDRHRVAVLFTDVTERKAAEERLQRSHDTFLNLIQNNPFGVYLVDADFRLARVSLGAQKVFAQVRPLLGRDFAEVLRTIWSEPAATEFIGRFQHTLATGEPHVSVDTTARRADVDNVESYDWRIEQVSLPDGRHGVVCYFYDMTERRRIEDALKDADRKKDDFIALLAHELRNPLAPIRNGLQVLRLGGANPDILGRARDMMDRQLTHMVRLIDDLLDVSRINRGKMELRRGCVDLAEVVVSAVETARPALDAAGHELMVTLPATPVVLDADLTRLSQVVSNLLTNSAKYTPKGGRVWLSAERAAGRVLVTVRDTGIGIPAESLPTIFGMFSQVDRSVEKSTGGLGIGLALVKGLVEMHGGTVTATSDGEGKGTTFTVSLAEAGRVEPPAPTDSGPEVRGPARRILVVDDNRDGAESLSQLLAVLGHEVRTAYDGFEAVEAAGAYRPDVVLMDVGMPRLNGYEATRQIRKQDWGEGMKIVALTGWGQDGDRKLSKEAGCDGHLVKPVSLPDLQQMLGELYVSR